MASISYHHSSRSYVKKSQIEELAKKKFGENGAGITIKDLMARFGIQKRQAQRTLKYFHEKEFIFTAQDLQKQGIKIKGFVRKKPQCYYLTSMQSQIIENRKKNVLNDTTGITSEIIETQRIQYLSDWFCKISEVRLQIHKLQIQTFVDKENYDLLSHLPKYSNYRVQYERIGNIQGQHNVEYQIYTNGTLMIFITCSENPFRLQYEEDVSKIMVFLGKVDDRLRYLLSDTRDKVVPPVFTWILKQCDVNKDIGIDAMAQVTLPDIQITTFEKVLRAYVKIIGEKAVLRLESGITSNEPISAALENIRKNIDLDRDFSMHKQEE